MSKRVRKYPACPSRPEDRLYDQVREIESQLGTGQGIGRIPSKGSNILKLPRRAEEPTPRVYLGEGLLALDAQAFVEFGLISHGSIVPFSRSNASVTEYFDAAAAQTEIDMAQYRQLAKQRRALLGEINDIRQRQLFPGWKAPRHRPDPLGENRFRAFDPKPHFEARCGFIQFIGR